MMLKLKHLDRALSYQAWMQGFVTPAFKESVIDMPGESHSDDGYAARHSDQKPQPTHAQPKPEI